MRKDSGRVEKKDKFVVREEKYMRKFTDGIKVRGKKIITEVRIETNVKEP